MSSEHVSTAVVSVAIPTLNGGPLLGEVYEFVRRHPELATGDGDERWQNIMLYAPVAITLMRSSRKAST